MIVPTEGVIVESTVLENEEATETNDAWVSCDTCRVARATWKVVGNIGGELFFCGHHKNKMEAGLSRWAKEFIDLGVH